LLEINLILMSTNLIASIGGWRLSVILAISQFAERRDQRKEGILYKALERLSGSHADRNIALALIEGWWPNSKKYDAILMPALISVAVHLLLDTRAQETRQEFLNWLRIMRLLIRRPYNREFGLFYDELHHAVWCCTQHGQSDPVGIGMTQEAALSWLKTIEANWDIGHLE
jgi:hypothetical protein